MVRTRLLIVLLLSCSAFVSHPIFGQTDAITVTTDKPSYNDGDTMTISGTVSDQLNIPISIVIKDDANNPVYIAQTNPQSDNTYSAQATAGGSLWKTTGTYEIDVVYGGTDKTAKTTFQFVKVQGQPSTNNENQTNSTQAIPEFGPLSPVIFSISIIAVITLYAKVRPSFKI